ncbi:MAG: Ig-like domain-containing protein, partial [Gemmatimonadota bacterium]
HVQRVAARIVLNRTTREINAGETFQFVGTVVDANGFAMEGQTISWASSNTSVVTVSSTGLARGVSAGKASISASSGLASGTAAVTVVGVTSSVGVLIVPQQILGVGNCFPFGGNTFHQFMGFMYRNVPPFSVQPGDRIAFDLGALNSQQARRNIFFSVANKNPAPPVRNGNELVSQDVRAVEWIKMVSETQIPDNPHGNTILGDFELVYTSEGSFSFPGGGFLIGFQATSGAGSGPFATFVDPGCEQVLAFTDGTDPSNLFYGRFLQKPNLTLGTLDNSGLSDATWIGGVKIYRGSAPPSRPITVVPTATRPVQNVSPFDLSIAMPDGTLRAVPSARPDTPKRKGVTTDRN